MRPRTGDLRNRVKLQVASTTQDSAGQEEHTWSDVATVWAKVSKLSGREAVHAAQIQADSDYKITIRYRSGVTTDMRFLWGTRVFNILDVLNPDELGHHLDCLAKEVTSG